ncbi:hypothetical protein DSL92_04870 [Billgrantia gudaonensis]|uniref:Uncharacterized protein n=1 Tax=Billgrantia gudaonensis TaxID=376427 RepID=A0A432JJ91_9GAMM|nr:hypothetical protein DSL92_04870 [Halomonas gudaonensis]
MGIEVTLERVDWPEWLEQVFNERDYDMTIVAHVEPMDIDIYARDDYYFNYHDAGFPGPVERIEAEQQNAGAPLAAGRGAAPSRRPSGQRLPLSQTTQAIHKAGLKGVYGCAHSSGGSQESPGVSMRMSSTPTFPPPRPASVSWDVVAFGRRDIDACAVRDATPWWYGRSREWTNRLVTGNRLRFGGSCTIGTDHVDEAVLMSRHRLCQRTGLQMPKPWWITSRAC